MRKQPEIHPLRVLRYRAGMTQKALSEATGVNVMNVSHIENYVFACGRTNALRIVDACRAEMEKAGVTVEDLLRGSM